MVNVLVKYENSNIQHVFTFFQNKDIKKIIGIYTF